MISTAQVFIIVPDFPTLRGRDNVKLRNILRSFDVFVISREVPGSARAG